MSWAKLDDTGGGRMGEDIDRTGGGGVNQLSDQSASARSEFIAYYRALGYDAHEAWLLAEARIEGARSLRRAFDEVRDDA